MIDSALWWLYEQTSFRQLSETYRAEEFMGPGEAHVQNEKELPLPLLFGPGIPILHVLRTAPPPATGVPTLCGDAAEPDMTWQRRWNATSSCSPPVGSMEYVIRETGGALRIRYVRLTG